jgi:hypothetical protein
LVGQRVGRSVGRSVGWSVSWSVSRLVNRSVGQLVSRPVSRSVGQLVSRSLFGRSIIRVPGLWEFSLQKDNLNLSIYFVKSYRFVLIKCNKLVQIGL